MDDELLRQFLGAVPAAGLLLFTARYWWRIQTVVTDRFEHLLESMRTDITRLEAQLSTERDARRGDNHRCEEQLGELRACLALLSPLFTEHP